MTLHLQLSLEIALIILKHHVILRCAPFSAVLHGPMEEFTIDSVVRGHHVYKSIWTPPVGEVLPTEVKDDKDVYAIAVLRGSVVVGHVPRTFSRIFYFFMRHGGTVRCEIIGRRKFGVGLEVPLCLANESTSRDWLNL